MSGIGEQHQFTVYQNASLNLGTTKKILMLNSNKLYTDGTDSVGVYVADFADLPSGQKLSVKVDSTNGLILEAAPEKNKTTCSIYYNNEKDYNNACYFDISAPKGYPEGRTNGITFSMTANTGPIWQPLPKTRKITLPVFNNPNSISFDSTTHGDSDHGDSFYHRVLASNETDEVLCVWKQMSGDNSKPKSNFTCLNPAETIFTHISDDGDGEDLYFTTESDVSKVSIENIYGHEHYYNWHNPIPLVKGPEYHHSWDANDKFHGKAGYIYSNNTAAHPDWDNNYSIVYTTGISSNPEFDTLKQNCVPDYGQSCSLITNDTQNTIYAYKYNKKNGFQFAEITAGSSSSIKVKPTADDSDSLYFTSSQINLSQIKSTTQLELSPNYLGKSEYGNLYSKLEMLIFQYTHENVGAFNIPWFKVSGTHDMIVADYHDDTTNKSYNIKTENDSVSAWCNPYIINTLKQSGKGPNPLIAQMQIAAKTGGNIYNLHNNRRTDAGFLNYCTGLYVGYQTIVSHK